MKKNNPPKKLTLVKKTIAHLSNEQLKTARGGDPTSMWACTDTKKVFSIQCKPTLISCI